MRKKRILLMAEAVTLAHVGRLCALAAHLNPEKFEIKLVSAPHFDHLLGDIGFAKGPLASISPTRFLSRLRAGRNPYDLNTLIDYVEEDLRQIKEYRPDLVIGDFRLSLAVSAKLEGIPYINIVNAHWSPFARPVWTVPTHNVMSRMGPRVGQKLFDRFRPIVFASFSKSFDRLLNHFGLAPMTGDFRSLYTAGDFVLYPDSPAVVPTYDLPANHRYLGPLIWSTKVRRPEWWSNLDASRPKVFLTLGSSGPSHLLSSLLRSMANENIQILAATSARNTNVQPQSNAFISDFIPAADAAEISDVLICNGGSGSINQAISAGIPIIGIADNLDQYLAMSFVEKAGFGLLLRADQIRPDRLRLAVREVLKNEAYRVRARELQSRAGSSSSGAVLLGALDEILREEIAQNNCLPA